MENAREVALITGASSGIGAAFARALAERGFDLVLVARRETRLVHLKEELVARHGVEVTISAADLTRNEDLERIAAEVSAEPRLALLVNNAGFGTTGFFYETEAKGQEQMHRLHVLATMALTHAALGPMVRRNQGAVINVASVAAFMPSAASVSYNSTKAWMYTFTESLYLELRSIGSKVRIQALCPGLTATEFHEQAGLDSGRLYRSSGLWMKAEKVVEDSLRGLERGRWCVVPGWRYRVLVWVLRYLPRWLRHRVALSYAARLRSLTGAKEESQNRDPADPVA
jgi:uncharacterized protein